MRNFIRRWMIARALRPLIAAHKTTLATRKVGQRFASELCSSVAVMGYHFDATNSLSEEMKRRTLSAETPTPKTKRAPGRQPLALSEEAGSMGLFGFQRAWRPMPPDARSAKWEDLHTWPAGGKPSGDPYLRMMGGARPLAFICRACDLEQPALTSDRDCPYCGMHYKLHGGHVFWWRQPGEPVPEWSPNLPQSGKNSN